jgi:hypothetical protein
MLRKRYMHAEQKHGPEWITGWTCVNIKYATPEYVLKVIDGNAVLLEQRKFYISILHKTLCLKIPLMLDVHRHRQSECVNYMQS